MNQKIEIDPNDFNESPFRLIGKEWMLITAEKDGVVNTMTASWGGLGVMWNMNVAFAVIRQSRYTKEFVDSAEKFSLSFLDHENYKKELGYLGTVSGRTEDKINKTGLSISYYEGVPYIKEAQKVMICNKVFAQKMEPENFIIPEIDSKFYSDKDYHDLYIGEITQTLVDKSIL